MGQHTNIQWADSTANPVTGCQGCELWAWREDLGKADGPCYAGALHEQRLAKALPSLYAPAFTEVRLAPGRMAKAAAWPDLRGKARPDKPWIDPATPRLIFVGDMGDVFSKAVPFEFLRDELIAAAASKAGRRHVWMILTKQPGRMALFARWLAEQGLDWPGNLWAGVSVTSEKTAGRLDRLMSVPAPVRFASYEPALGPVDFDPWLDCGYESGGPAGWVAEPSLDLIIVGGESDQGEHQGRPFDLQWARDTIADARRAGAAVFIKQLGSAPFVDRNDEVGGGIHCHLPLTLRDGHGGDWSEWPADLRVRQIPEARHVD